MESVAAEETVRRFIKLWASGDIDASLRFIADDAVYALYISREVLPFGGETVGLSNIERALRLMRSQWDYLLFRPRAIVAIIDTVRVRVERMYRHRASGEVLSGNFASSFAYATILSFAPTSIMIARWSRRSCGCTPE